MIAVWIFTRLVPLWLCCDEVCHRRLQPVCAICQPNLCFNGLLQRFTGLVQGDLIILKGIRRWVFDKAKLWHVVQVVDLGLLIRPPNRQNWAHVRSCWSFPLVTIAQNVGWTIPRWCRQITIKVIKVRTGSAVHGVVGRVVVILGSQTFRNLWCGCWHFLTSCGIKCPHLAVNFASIAFLQLTRSVEIIIVTSDTRHADCSLTVSAKVISLAVSGRVEVAEDLFTLGVESHCLAGNVLQSSQGVTRVSVKIVSLAVFCDVGALCLAASGIKIL